MVLCCCIGSKLSISLMLTEKPNDMADGCGFDHFSTFVVERRYVPPPPLHA